MLVVAGWGKMREDPDTTSHSAAAAAAAAVGWRCYLGALDV